MVWESEPTLGCSSMLLGMGFITIVDNIRFHIDDKQIVLGGVISNLDVSPKV